MSKKRSLGIKTEIELEVRDKNGKLLSKKRVDANSWVKNFVIALRTMFQSTAKGLGYLQITGSVKDLTDAAKTFYGTFLDSFPSMKRGGLSPMGLRASAEDDSMGLVVGSGTTAVTRDDYHLATQISHGVDTGELQYGAVTVEDVNGAPPSTTFKIVRTFTNGSGAAITVNEIGLYVFNIVDDDNVLKSVNFMIARDVLVSPVSVPAEATLTVRYIVSVTA